MEVVLVVLALLVAAGIGAYVVNLVKKSDAIADAELAKKGTPEAYVFPQRESS